MEVHKRNGKGKAGMFGKKQLRKEFELYKQVTSKELESAYEYVIELNHRVLQLEEDFKSIKNGLDFHIDCCTAIREKNKEFDDSKMITKDGLYSYKVFRSRTGTGKGTDED